MVSCTDFRFSYLSETLVVAGINNPAVGRCANTFAQT